MPKSKEDESAQGDLEARYASPRMRAIWSARRKFTTWRRLWLALAEAEHELGLRQVSEAQLQAMREHLDDIDFDAAARYERELRHDVMAHIRAWGDQIPVARPIMHLGATSQFVNCNTELIQMREGLQVLAAKTARVLDALGRFASRWRDLPTLGFTHLQPAQPTTVGKRASMWAQELALGLEDLEHRLQTMRFRGAKGATGTQASFLALFDGDEAKVERLDALVTAKMGFHPDDRFLVTGQTYPRLLDAQILSSLAVVAAAAHKMACDLRLLAGRHEIEEPFEDAQVGSSAMAYKRNPMRCERACGLARFVMSLPANAFQTAATQWLERTLDDSSNRRLVLPQAFLALDGVLDILHNVAEGLVVNEAVIRAALEAELPFLATENIMMAAVAAGADRQEAHEVIRRHSHEVAARVRAGGKNDLLERLGSEKMFAAVDLRGVLDPDAYVGLAPAQVDRFLEEVIDPIRATYAAELSSATELRV